MIGSCDWPPVELSPSSILFQTPLIVQVELHSDEADDASLCCLMAGFFSCLLTYIRRCDGY